MAKIIFGLVGPLAGGKGTVKKYIEEKYHGKDCRFSTSLRDVLNRLDVPTSRENLQKLSTVLRGVFGEDLLSKAIAKEAVGLDADIVVIDGVRRMTDISHLLPQKNFVLVAVDADPKIRFERLVSRNENAGDDKKTFRQFLKDHESEADRQVPEVMKSAKETINNDGTLEDLYQQVDSLVKRYIR